VQRGSEFGPGAREPGSHAEAEKDRGGEITLEPGEISNLDAHMDYHGSRIGSERKAAEDRGPRTDQGSWSVNDLLSPELVEIVNGAGPVLYRSLARPRDAVIHLLESKT